MITTAAVYERDMKAKLEALNHGTQLQAEQAVAETVEVLKQFGYEKGAEIFQKIVYKAVEENIINFNV